MRQQDDTLPKAITGPKEDARFEDIAPDYFWTYYNWMFGIIICLMGCIALKDMFNATVNYLLGFSWVGVAALGFGMMAYIHKAILRK